MLTNILKKIATVFNRTACSLEHRANHIDKLETLTAKNKELTDEIDTLKGERSALENRHQTVSFKLFDLEEEMNAKNIEIVDLNEKADHPTRHKIEACIQDMITQDRLPGVSPVQLKVLDNRVDDLENKLDKLHGHIVHRDYQEFLAEEAAQTQTDDDRAKINDAIDEDDDEYIDPIERIMSMKPVGQFPPAKGE